VKFARAHGRSLELRGCEGRWGNIIQLEIDRVVEDAANYRVDRRTLGTWG
jgi:hypothetical protein